MYKKKQQFYEVQLNSFHLQIQRRSTLKQRDLVNWRTSNRELELV